MPRPDDQPVQVPGATTVEATDQAADALAATDAPDELAELRAQLAAKDAELAALKSVAAPGGETFVPTIAPHGAVAMAESEFRGMTSSQVAAKVKAGEITLGGKPSVLCADGYYCDPAYR